MKWGRFAVLALALVVSACAEREPTSGEDRGGESSPRAALETNGAGTFTYEVWFADGDGLLLMSKPETNVEPETSRVAKIVLTNLLAGPSEAEVAAGVITAIPTGTELLDLSIEDGIATVDLSSEYEQGSGSWGESLRLAQVVYTLTQFETVKAVDFRLEGQPVKLFGGHGRLVDTPQARRDFRDFLPTQS